MAAPIYRLGYFGLRYSTRISSRRRSFQPIITFPRNIQTTTISREDSREDARNDAPQKSKFDISILSPEERNSYDFLSPEEKLEFEENFLKLDEHMNSPRVRSELTAEASTAAYELSQEIDPEDDKTPRIKPGFMAMGEEDEQGTGEDDEYQGDDITSLGHGELEQHREMREYARIAAWEMPLLNKFAQTFRQPSRKEPLRFRYTTYMGETHPAEKKIVLEVCTSDLPGLTDKQRIKLIKLVGPRYNPQTDVVKMSCEMFPTQAENKSYLRDLVNSLIKEAKDNSDTFEDVPLDFRHHEFKQKLEFPESWKMTPERKAKLQSERENNLLAERERESKGEVVNGVDAIERWVNLLASREREPKPVSFQGSSGQPPKRKGKLRR